MDSSTFYLKDPSRTGYRFDGWYENGMQVTSIAKGSTGNRVLTAKWSQLYTISFNATFEQTFQQYAFGTVGNIFHGGQNFNPVVFQSFSVHSHFKLVTTEPV